LWADSSALPRETREVEPLTRELGRQLGGLHLLTTKITAVTFLKNL
jgi:hypothetical protein